MTQINDQADFSIINAYIERRRYSGQEDDIEQQWDIRQSVLEVNMFESIYEPVMTGKVVVLDTASLSSIINFQGQEILHLEWRVGETQYNREFYIFSVANQLKSSNTTTSSLVLHVIEKHGYYSMFRRLNGTKAGEIGQIVDAILSEVESGLTSASESAQRIRIMENNRMPLEVIQWLMNRATNDIGEPMFTYSTLAPNVTGSNANIKFRSLSEMMQDHPWDADFKFVYSMIPSSTTEDAITRDRTRINAVHIGENDNIFTLAQAGAISSQYFQLDLTNRSQEEVKFNIEDHAEDRRAGASTSTMTDSFFTINRNGDTETQVSTMDSLYVSGINTTAMFDDYRGYNEESDYRAHRFKISRESDLVMIDKEKFSITVPGYHFGATDDERGVGTTINITIPKDQPVLTSDANSVDPKRSGKFLILNARHIMNNATNTYMAVLEIGRPDSPDNINDETRYENEAQDRPR